MFLQLLALIICTALQPPVQVNAGSYDADFVAEIIKFGKVKDTVTPEHEKSPKYWSNLSQQELRNNIRKQQLNTNRVKNVIFFMGDGMSLNTVTAARILQGQRKGHTGEEEMLSFEKFPHIGLSKTYCANAQVADSACSATAYLCGVKGNLLTIGVNAHVHFNNCTEGMDARNHVSSIANWAQKTGMATGFITTTTLTHASPSGLHAHVASRFYESDADVESFGGDPEKCMDIATQLITREPGRNFDVLMGGGMSKFLPNTEKDAHGNMGIRKDGKNLLTLWKNKHPDGMIVSNREELLNLNTSQVTNIMGIFQSKYMDFHLKADPSKQPTLTEMTETAIKLMNHKPKGYFLFVEGGLIDVAHHESMAAAALDETLEFAKAIDRAREITSEEDTLIVVTADHGHTLSISGYPPRGNDILGPNQHMFDINGEKYLTLNYATGSQQYLDQNGKRLNLENINRDAYFQYPAYINTSDSRHGGDDVGIYASGPYAHLFAGVMEQTTIPHTIAYAACIGDNPTMCDDWYEPEK